MMDNLTTYTDIHFYTAV